MVQRCTMHDDWDDLRYFLAVTRHGSIRATARALGVNHATVSRRLDALESALGSRLLERGSRGYTPTPEGEVLRLAVERAADAFQEADLAVQGRDARLGGTVRITLPDVLVPPVARWLAPFRQHHGEIDYEIVSNNTGMDLLRREADIALRITEHPPPDLIGRRLGKIAVAIYASREAMEFSHPLAHPLTQRPWLRWDEQWRAVAIERWMDKHVAPELVGARVNTHLAMHELIAAGVGVGFLACWLAEPDPRLVRISEPNDALGFDIWMLTHRALRTTARVRVLFDHLGEAFVKEREAIEGANLAPLAEGGMGSDALWAG